MLKLYNTLGRTVQEFHPRNPGKVDLYACGPTVYNFAHIGNLRAYLFEDFLRRAFEYLGYELTHVMNVTDVGHLTDDGDEGEDKMLKSARERGMSVWEIAQFYADAFFADTDRLNILKPHVVCRATDHIDDMIKLIRRIEENGYTYAAGGNLYFDIARFPTYGELALLDRSDLKSGARVAVDPNKRNPQDFVLWFTQSKFGRQTMVWDSPWGRGYPGWHIECSAMSTRYLGEQFDIHCGGVDHIPVHHTNEIAQTEAATGKKWVNYWLHGEFLVMEDSKMSKSAGGFITLDSLIEAGFAAMDYRFFNLGAHYRTQLQFTFDSLTAARNGRLRLIDRIVELMKVAGNDSLPAVVEASGTHSPRTDVGQHADELQPAGTVQLTGTATPYLEAFRNHLEDDLNAPRCIAEVWGLVKDDRVKPSDALRALAEMDRVLGLRLIGEAWSKLEASREDALTPELLDLIRRREDARRDRDFRTADEIRGILKDRGVAIEDGPNGTRWKKL